MNWFTKKIPVVVTQEKGAAVDLDGIGWISVRERIPEYGVRVLCADTTYGVVSGYRVTQDNSGDTWKLGIVEYSFGYSSQAQSKGITHWMPLPPAP